MRVKNSIILEKACATTIKACDWDENKSKTNLVKHGISFETEKLVFDDQFVLSQQDRHKDGEEHWQTLGLINGIVILLVAHTFHE